MSTLTAPTTTPTDETTPARVGHPELIALTEALTTAAEAHRTALPTITLPGARRRATKLAAQLRAASRLVANGVHLEPPATTAALTMLAKSAANYPSDDSSTVSEIDSDIRSWRSTLVSLHTWRGHTGSLPADQ